MIVRRIALAALLLGSPPASAQAPAAPAAPRPAPVWQMDWGNHFCTLARLPTPDTPFAVAFRSVPGSFFVGLRLVPMGSATPPRGTTRIVLMPSGRSYEAEERIETLAGGLRVGAFGPLPDSLWGVLEGSSELRLMRGERVTHRIGLSRSQAAVRSYRQCEADAMSAWGIDGGALNALSQRPVSTNSFGLTDTAYPMSAVHSGTSGRMVVRVTVSPEGRATDCAVVSTSNSQALDAAACPAILRHARFRIPLDAQGRPTTVRIVTAITWLTPR